MQNAERKVAEAAASLTVDDFGWLQDHGMIPEAACNPEKPLHAHASGAQQEAVAQESRPTEEKTKRKHPQREWPEVGTVLEAGYFGNHYEAEVIEAPQLKSGKALKILTGPAAGKVCRSVSGAMLQATEAQREANGLGRAGVANGWQFWKVKDHNTSG